MNGSAFQRGVVLLVKAMTPKKPNSANRKVARVRLSNGKEVTAYVPGDDDNHTRPEPSQPWPVQEHSIVLVRGGGVPDLPGIRYKVVRGTLGCRSVEASKQARSKYGRKKPR